MRRLEVTPNLMSSDTLFDTAVVCCYQQKGYKKTPGSEPAQASAEHSAYYQDSAESRQSKGHTDPGVALAEALEPLQTPL
jgi:hypothetical protein